MTIQRMLWLRKFTQTVKLFTSYETCWHLWYRNNSLFVYREYPRHASKSSDFRSGEHCMRAMVQVGFSRVSDRHFAWSVESTLTLQNTTWESCGGVLVSIVIKPWPICEPSNALLGELIGLRPRDLSNALLSDRPEWKTWVIRYSVIISVRG